MNLSLCVQEDVGEEIQKEEEPGQQDDYNDYEDDFEVRQTYTVKLVIACC